MNGAEVMRQSVLLNSQVKQISHDLSSYDILKCTRGPPSKANNYSCTVAIGSPFFAALQNGTFDASLIQSSIQDDDPRSPFQYLTGVILYAAAAIVLFFLSTAFSLLFCCCRYCCCCVRGGLCGKRFPTAKLPEGGKYPLSSRICTRLYMWLFVGAITAAILLGHTYGNAAITDAFYKLPEAATPLGKMASNIKNPVKVLVVEVFGRTLRGVLLDLNATIATDVRPLHLNASLACVDTGIAAIPRVEAVDAITGPLTLALSKLPADADVQQILGNLSNIFTTLPAMLVTVNTALDGLNKLSTVLRSSTIDYIRGNFSEVFNKGSGLWAAANESYPLLAAYVNNSLTSLELTNVMTTFAQSTIVPFVWASIAKGAGDSARATLTTTLTNIKTKLNAWPDMAQLSGKLADVTDKSGQLRAQLALLMPMFDVLYNASLFVTFRSVQYAPMIAANANADALMMSYNSTSMLSMLTSMVDVLSAMPAAGFVGALDDDIRRSLTVLPCAMALQDQVRIINRTLYTSTGFDVVVANTASLNASVATELVHLSELGQSVQEMENARANITALNLPRARTVVSNLSVPFSDLRNTTYRLTGLQPAIDTLFGKINSVMLPVFRGMYVDLQAALAPSKLNPGLSIASTGALGSMASLKTNLVVAIDSFITKVDLWQTKGFCESFGTTTSSATECANDGDCVAAGYTCNLNFVGRYPGVCAGTAGALNTPGTKFCKLNDDQYSYTPATSACDTTSPTACSVTTLLDGLRAGVALATTSLNTQVVVPSADGASLAPYLLALPPLINAAWAIRDAGSGLITPGGPLDLATQFVTNSPQLVANQAGAYTGPVTAARAALVGTPDVAGMATRWPKLSNQLSAVKTSIAGMRTQLNSVHTSVNSFQNATIMLNVVRPTLKWLTNYVVADAAYYKASLDPALLTTYVQSAPEGLGVHGAMVHVLTVANKFVRSLNDSAMIRTDSFDLVDMLKIMLELLPVLEAGAQQGSDGALTFLENLAMQALNTSYTSVLMAPNATLNYTNGDVLYSDPASQTKWPDGKMCLTGACLRKMTRELNTEPLADLFGESFSWAKLSREQFMLVLYVVPAVIALLGLIASVGFSCPAMTTACLSFCTMPLIFIVVGVVQFPMLMVMSDMCSSVENLALTNPGGVIYPNICGNFFNGTLNSTTNVCTLMPPTGSSLLSLPDPVYGVVNSTIAVNLPVLLRDLLGSCESGVKPGGVDTMTKVFADLGYAAQASIGSAAQGFIDDATKPNGTLANAGPSTVLILNRFRANVMTNMPAIAVSLGTVLTCAETNAFYVSVKETMCCGILGGVVWYVISWYFIGLAMCFCGCGAGILGHKRFLGNVSQWQTRGRLGKATETALGEGGVALELIKYENVRWGAGDAAHGAQA